MPETIQYRSLDRNMWMRYLVTLKGYGNVGHHLTKIAIDYVTNFLNRYLVAIRMMLPIFANRRIIHNQLSGLINEIPLIF